MDWIPEEKGDLVETEEILDALRRKEMTPAKKSMLVEMIQEDLTQITEEEGDLVETERILDTLAKKKTLPAEKILLRRTRGKVEVLALRGVSGRAEVEGGGSGFDRSFWKLLLEDQPQAKEKS